MCVCHYDLILNHPLDENCSDLLIYVGYFAHLHLWSLPMRPINDYSTIQWRNEMKLITFWWCLNAMNDCRWHGFKSTHWHIFSNATTAFLFHPPAKYIRFDVIVWLLCFVMRMVWMVANRGLNPFSFFNSRCWSKHTVIHSMFKLIIIKSPPRLQTRF